MKLDENTKLEIIERYNLGFNLTYIGNQLRVSRTAVSDFLKRKSWKSWWEDFDQKDNLLPEDGPKILILDIEISPILASVWKIFKENVSIEQIKQDWFILSWAAKWLHENEVFYEDKRNSWNDEDDSDLIKNIWNLLNEADIVITQNGKRFDEKKLNTRFILNGMKPPSSYRHIDVLESAKRYFGFTSNKLGFTTDKLCKKYKKIPHEKFPGFMLWKECLAGNPGAWEEMEVYNIHDVLSLEELYLIVLPWIKNHPNINTYYKDNTIRCKCGDTNFKHNGYHHTNLSKFDRFECVSCGSEVRGRVNLLPKNKRISLRSNIVL